MVRIGWGYDIHRLFPDRLTVLGGVEFPDFPYGFDTHSDGDVVAHAIIDALAGALAAGSLGDYFPEDDPADQDVRSIEFLDRFRPVMARKHAEVINLDCTIFCSAPRIGPVATEMRHNIALGLGCTVDRVNVKGKTNDGFGPEGEGLAISATVLAQVLVGAASAQSPASGG
jgi:2-C-methyl-D-erythritol 2,4-cyclodiphosphate synthase